MVCSGCDHVLREGNTSYYCPATENILFFNCDITQHFILRWQIDGVDIFVYSTPNQPRYEVYGVYSVHTPNIDFDDDPVGNFTSILWFDTADIMDNVTVTCAYSQHSESMLIKPVGQ